MKYPHETLLAKAYAAFNARDIDGALALMHPNVEWPNGWEGGWVRGHSGVRDYWSRQWKVIDPHVEPIAYSHPRHDDDVLRVRVRQEVRDLEGALLDAREVVHAYDFEDGLVCRMNIEEGDSSMYLIPWQRNLLLGCAAVGLIVPNGIFLYYVVTDASVVSAAQTNPVAAAFIGEALFLMVLFAWLLKLALPKSRHWLGFLAASMIGSLAFSIPLFAVLVMRRSAELDRHSAAPAAPDRG